MADGPLNHAVPHRFPAGATPPAARHASDALPFAHTYQLAEHDPRIRRVLTRLSEWPDDAQAAARLEYLLRRHRTFHQDYPFVVGPPGSLDAGWLPIGTQVADGQTISLQSSEIARNLLVLGSTGTGKTNEILTIADAVLSAGYDIWFFDLKRDAARLAVRHNRLLALHADAPIDLFAKPPYLTLSAHIATIIEPLARATYGGQTQRAIAHEVFTRLFAEHDHPTLRHAIELLRTLPRKGDTYDRLNAIRNLSTRLQRFERYPGLATGGGIPAYELSNRSVLFPYVTMGDLEEFLTAYFVTQLFHHHRAANIRTFRTLIAFEESLLLFRGEGGTSRISGNAVAELIGLTREFGTGWVLSANTAHLLDPATVSNIFAVIALNASSGTEAEFVGRVCGFTREQLHYYRFELSRGRAIIRLNDRHREPIVATLTPWPYEKTVTTAEWVGVCARIDALATTFAPRTPTIVTNEPARTTPPSRPPHKSATEETRTIALNEHALEILQYTATHGVVLTTEAFRETGTHPQAGTRDKKQMLGLGLLEEERIVVHRGRGGTAIAIRPTRSGYERVGIKREPMRTGSLQHEWLVRSLAARIPKSSIELSIGGKSCDLVLPYEEGLHARLAAFVCITPEPGAIIAIEVEVSRPSTRNVTRNDSVGIPFTIIATMTPLRESTDTIVVDVFALLEAL